MKTEVIRINPEQIDSEKMQKAAQLIRQGEVLAFPTETVYGLAADFFNRQAVDKIFELKKRPRQKPLTVQIRDIRHLERIARDIPTAAYQLMSRFWPGPLTLVLPACKASNPAGGSRKQSRTIGVRIPDNKIALSLIEESQTLLVAPSANLSGRPEAQTAEDVLQTFDGLIAMVIDGGKVELGMASTVVDFSTSPYKILRAGTISREELEVVIG